MSRPRAQAGFTLIEVMVAGVIGVLVIGTAVLTMVDVQQRYTRGRQLADMRRASGLAHEQLATELRQAGLGLPSGKRFDGAHEAYPAAMLVGQASQLAFSVDVPRPDSNFNGLSGLSSVQALLPASGLGLLNEQNNNCDPFLGDTPCATNTSSLLFGALTPSCGSDPSAPSCPWSLHRYRAREYLLVVAGTGAWLQRQVDTSPAGTDGTLRFLALAAALPAGFPEDPTSGFVSTPDRVFYRFAGTLLERNQCWGDAGAVVSTATLAAPCAAGATTGTGWETLATGVTGFNVQYLDSSGTLLPLPLTGTNLGRVARVSAFLSLARGPNGSVTLADSTEITLRAKVPP